MKILLINGSLRAKDACGEAVQRAAERLRGAGAETEVFWPVRTADLPCSGCGVCRGAGMCVADPRAGEFLRAAASCELLAFFAPVGLLGVGVPLKNLMERAALLSSRRGGQLLEGKRAAALPIGRRSASSARQLARLLSGLGLPPLRGDGDAPEKLLCEIIEEGML